MSRLIKMFFHALGVRDVGTMKNWAWLAAAGVMVFFALSWRDFPHNWYEATQTDRRPFSKIGSWHYQLQKVEIDKVAAVAADLVVIDYERALDNGTRLPWTADEIAKLKVKPDGTRRFVLSYLSVGEAEEKRFYWKADWKTDPSKKPGWLHIPNCAWPGAWAVRFWYDGWKQILYRKPDSYLSRVIAAGFDGVYLDRVDMFQDFPQIETVHRGANIDMIELVVDLAQTARAAKPGFVVVPNNGMDLLNSRRYRQVIDGLGMEELLYSHKGTGVRNDQRDIDSTLAQLSLLQWDYKPVLTLEYLVTRETIVAASAELSKLKVIAGFPTRALDGGDPTAPVELKTDPGTPEFIAANCTATNSW